MIVIEVDAEDALSIATPPIGYCNLPEDQTFVSKMICFFFAPHDSSSINRFHPNDVHTQ
jgi:hypothetical protein